MQYLNINYYRILLSLCLIIAFMPPIISSALVLENLIAEKTDDILIGKKICFYPGSFDPLHLGHEKVAMGAIQNNLCDLTLIYPIWQNNDSRQSKSLTDISIRIEMLMHRFAHEEKIIVTALPPINLQQTLLKHHENEIQILHNIEFIGIVGSDNALTKWPQSSQQSFMRGMQIPKQHYYNSIGSIMALPVTSFIVALRDDDDISILNDEISSRPIIAVLNDRITCNLSSTAVRNHLYDGGSPDIPNMLSLEVQRVIAKYNLYTHKQN